MRNLTLHKFLAMLLMTVSCATLSVAQNVAQIGTKGYATLQAAADAAKAGQTVTLINDVDLTTGSNLEVHKWLNIVLDMNGHSIKGANADHKNICVSGKVYNLQGVVVGNTTEGLPKGVYIKNGRKIIVK